MDTFGYIYLGSFIFGIVLTVADWLTGGTTLPRPAEGGNARMEALIVALIWFGVGGFVGVLAGAEVWWSIPGALLSGAISFIIALFFLLHDEKDDLTPQTLHGQVARVSTPISSTNAGEVVFWLKGTAYVLPALCLENGAFEMNDQVVIVNGNRELVYVESLTKLLKEVGAEKWMTS
jgi:hypothetical protein